MVPRRTILLIAAPLLLLALPLIVPSEYLLHLIIVAGIWTVMASGMNLSQGCAGDLSLAQNGFYGLGGYTSALLFTKLGLPFWVGLPVAALIVGVLGLLIGAISLRHRGGAFIILTLSFGALAHLVVTNWVGLTNGLMGISRIGPPVLFGYPLATKVSYYYLVLAFAALWVFLSSRVIHSQIGRAWTAVRENELLAASLGVDTFRFALGAFTASAASAGVAGALYAHYSSFISPEMLTFDVNITLLIMIVLGGKGTVFGPVLGAVTFTVLPEFLRVASDWRLPIFGLLLILLVLYTPNGVIPAIQAWRARRAPSGAAGGGVGHGSTS
jgi:branched-chain amino acid transport system permease protein